MHARISVNLEITYEQPALHHPPRLPPHDDPWGALSWTVPSFVAQTFSALHAQADGALTQVTTGKDGPILVLIQLAGGNDGLNAVVPYTNDYYFKARPTIGIPANQVLTLNDTLG